MRKSRLCSQPKLYTKIQARRGRKRLKMLVRSSDSFTGCGEHHSPSSQTGSCTCRKGTGGIWCTFGGTDWPFLHLGSQFLAQWLVLQLKQNRIHISKQVFLCTLLVVVSTALSLTYGSDRLAIRHDTPRVSKEQATAMKKAGGKTQDLLKPLL